MEKTAPRRKSAVISLATGMVGLGLVFWGTGCPIPTCTDAQCDDGLFCNGAETCVNNQCQAGVNPCTEGETCDEENDACVPAATPCEFDTDCGQGEFCDTQTGECVTSENLYTTVEFDHTTHSTGPDALDCATCHHEGAGSTRCDTCHDRDEVVDGVPILKDVQHNPDNYGCRSCHDDRNDDGTWDCSVCHTALNEP